MVGPSSSRRLASRQHHGAIGSRDDSFIRKGPLYLSFFILLLIPGLVVTFLNTGLNMDSKLLKDQQQWENNPSTRNSALVGESNTIANKLSIYKGPSWMMTVDGVQNSAIVPPTVVETTTASCQKHTMRQESKESSIRNPTGIIGIDSETLLLQELDVVQVVVIDSIQRIWFLASEEDYDGAKQGDDMPHTASAIPEENRRWRPIHGTVPAESAGISPWMVAQQILLKLGIHASPENAKSDSGYKLRTDQYGLLDGSIPSEGETLSDGPTKWTYLGRHRSMAERGGAFVHSYLVQGVHESSFDPSSKSSKGLKSLTILEAQAALLGGRFGDLQSVGTISLVLLALLSDSVNNAKTT